MDSFEADRIARGRAKVTNGKYDRGDIDVRSYLDYEQKQINRQENLDRESRKRDEENRDRQRKIEWENEIQEGVERSERLSNNHWKFITECKEALSKNDVDNLYHYYDRLIGSCENTDIWSQNQISNMQNFAKQIESKINSINPTYLPLRRAAFAKYEKERNEKYLKEKAELKSQKISRFITVTLSKVALTIFLGFCFAGLAKGINNQSKDALSCVVLIIPVGSALLYSIFWIFMYDEKKD